MADNDEEPINDEESDSGSDDIPITKREFTSTRKDWKYLGSFNSGNLVTRRLPHLIVRTTKGVIAAGIIYEHDYDDDRGVCWAGETWPATARLDALEGSSNRYQVRYECTNADGSGTVTVYSREPVEDKYWVREVLGLTDHSNYGCIKTNYSIPRCVQQLKIKEVEELAPLLNTDTLSVLAYLCRSQVLNVNLKGNVCHLFLPSRGNPESSVNVKPISRSKLEGVTLLRIDDEDYSLVTGKRVGYELVGEVYHVYEEGGSLRRIDDEALVGCDMILEKVRVDNGKKC